MAEDVDGRVYARDVAEHAGPDAVFVVGVHVFVEGGVGVGAFVVVVAGLFVHHCAGVGFEFFDGEAVEVVGGCGGHGGRLCDGGAGVHLGG